LQIATFVVLSFLVTGSYVADAFVIILYFFLTDFVKIALSTDNLKWSQKPDTWNIIGLVKASLALSALVIAESFALLYVGLNVLHFSVAEGTLYTFNLEVLFYSAIFLIFNVRERGHFWDSRPSRTLLTAIIVSIIVATILTTTGTPGLTPVPLRATLFVMASSAAFSFLLNDLIKSSMVKKAEIRW
jgi:H+-transporting ATPase